MLTYRHTRTTFVSALQIVERKWILKLFYILREAGKCVGIFFIYSKKKCVIPTCATLSVPVKINLYRRQWRGRGRSDMSFYTLRNGNAFEVQKHILERKSYVSRKNSSKRKKKKKKKEKTKLTFMRHLYVYVSTYIYASTCAYLIIHTYICLARDRLAINFVRRKPHAHKC